VTNRRDEEAESGLILAAEECPPESFERFHRFSIYDEPIIRKLMAHGPVLVRGGRGSGKSALLIEAYRRMINEQNVFPIYLSLRYLPLLQSDGDEYIKHFCGILCKFIAKEIESRQFGYQFEIVSEQSALRFQLNDLSRFIDKRIVLLFDDAAHIGREKSLEGFFDLFRTIASNLISCKATIYPGVTKFGIRFDVFNDSTVIDVSRSDISIIPDFFPDVVKARYPKLGERATFSDRLTPNQFANLLGRAVVGNLRGLILACNRFDGQEKIGIPEVTKCFLEMATDYYWPLMDEVAPKLGIYEPLVEPSREVMEAILRHVARQVKIGSRRIAPDRVLVHRQLVSRFAKIFEILEYLGFLARKEASRALKSGGRGPVFSLNMCNVLDSIPSKRLTIEMIESWLEGSQEPAEIHISGQNFGKINLPELPEEHGLAILDKSIEVLAKSFAYPYGLTQNLIHRLTSSQIKTVGQLANTSDKKLDAIDYVGAATIKRIHDVIYQAIWM
jgi:hypothetical protein